ncbi:hypothetical protein TNIN_460131 [Trichonephila inaurata madagascariensis]|uniref:Uncharacterized protein n=1 Tax=Trichonephila inaurata madagascariensis TaxID=2747483 RepID=A0A8X7C983_9ARAC|nr:hypothetical protein TNIN_460131 [Trichonephila inaurata madagascariensis]
MRGVHDLSRAAQCAYRGRNNQVLYKWFRRQSCPVAWRNSGWHSSKTYGRRVVEVFVSTGFYRSFNIFNEKEKDTEGEKLSA